MGKTIAEEWERKIPGFVEDVIEKSKQSGDHALRLLLDFLSWEPTPEQRALLAEMKRRREQLDGFSFCRTGPDPDHGLCKTCGKPKDSRAEDCLDCWREAYRNGGNVCGSLN